MEKTQNFLIKFKTGLNFITSTAFSDYNCPDFAKILKHLHTCAFLDIVSAISFYSKKSSKLVRNFLIYAQKRNNETGRIFLAGRNRMFFEMMFKIYHKKKNASSKERKWNEYYIPSGELLFL